MYAIIGIGESGLLWGYVGGLWQPHGTSQWVMPFAHLSCLFSVHHDISHGSLSSILLCFGHSFALYFHSTYEQNHLVFVFCPAQSPHVPWTWSGESQDGLFLSGSAGNELRPSHMSGMSSTPESSPRPSFILLRHGVISIHCVYFEFFFFAQWRSFRLILCLGCC